MLVALLFLSNALALEATYPPKVQKVDIAPTTQAIEGLTWRKGDISTSEETSVSASKTRALMTPYRTGMAALLQSEKWYAGNTSDQKHGGPDAMMPVIPLLMGSSFQETEDALAELNNSESSKVTFLQRNTVRSNYRLRLADDGTVRAALVGVQTITLGRGRSVSNTDTMVVFSEGVPSAIFQSQSTWNGTRETLITLDVSEDGTLNGGTVATVEPQYEEADRAMTASLVLP